MAIELIETGTGNLKEDFRNNLINLITSSVYENYEQSCRTLGTSDLVLVINGDAPEGDMSRRGYVFRRTQLAEDTNFPLGIRETLKLPALPRTPMQGLRTFWAVVLWNKNVAALAIGVKEMSHGGDA